MLGRVVIVMLALLAAASGAVALWPEVAPRPDTEFASVPVTPVLSLRRVPTVLSSLVADGRLTASLDGALADPGLGGGQERTCLSVYDADGRAVYARNVAVPLIPASNMKLFTATAALARLGPDARLTTEVRAASSPDGGVVAGDLWLVGGGDPLLAGADFASTAGYLGGPRLATSLEALADRVVASGVRQVQGRVVGDESRYDTQRYIPTWSPNYITQAEIGPMSALTVNGGFAQWQPQAVPAPSPPANVAAVLTSTLRARGVAVGGEAGEGVAPAGAVGITAIESPTLAEVVGVLLRESDNMTAELLVKELGARFGGAGTTAAGLQVVRETLSSLGPAAGDLAAADGSGLDRSDRLSCNSLQAVLGRESEQSILGRSLPLAGQDGTLTRRFRGTPAAGKIRAKTGSLQGVVALSGWASARDGRSVRFALVANELPAGAGSTLEDRVAAALVAYPDAPPPSELGPAPARPRPMSGPGGRSISTEWGQHPRMLDK